MTSGDTMTSEQWMSNTTDTQLYHTSDAVMAVQDHATLEEHVTNEHMSTLPPQRGALEHRERVTA